MFFRQKKSPSGQCLQLLESYRNGQGQPRQHVVVSLGGLTIAQADRALIARLVEQRLHGQTQLQCLSDNAGALSLADSISKRVEREGRWRPVPVAACPGPSEGASATIDGVMLDLITHTHTTPVGPTLVGWQAWKRLGMPELLGKLGFNPAQEQAAATSVINRLIDPGSELALVDWLPNSSLPELMEMEIGPAAKDRFYRVSDRLFEHRHRVFNGNQSDSKSLIHMIEEMDKLVPLKDKQSTVLLDGGIATKANLALLRKKHYHYLVNDSRRGRANYRAELLKEDEFTVVGKREDKSEVRVRKMADPLWVAPAAQAAAKEDKAASAAADSPPDKGKPPQEGPEVADTLVLCWSGKTYRIRKAGEPEELQKSIYEKLDVKWDRLPETKLEVETEAIL